MTAAEAKFLEAATIHRLLKSAESSRYAPFFEFLLDTGLRRGEALALNWSDIDMDNQHFRVRCTLARVDGDLRVTDLKSEKSRRAVPISAPALAVLERVRERTGHDRSAARQVWRETGYVFVTDIGEPCDPRNALRALDSAAGKAGLKEVGLRPRRARRLPRRT